MTNIFTLGKIANKNLSSAWSQEIWGKGANIFYKKCDQLCIAIDNYHGILFITRMLHEKIATDDNMYTITIRYTLKGTVSSRDWFQKYWQKVKELGLTKRRNWFLKF